MKNDIWSSCAYTVSLITLDHCNLESQIRILEKSGVDLLHVDILDGHFSPSTPTACGAPFRQGGRIPHRLRRSPL